VGSCFTVTLTAGRARPAPGRFDFEKETVVQEETASDRGLVYIPDFAAPRVNVAALFGNVHFAFIW
jgi:hypothetical protein